MEWSVFVQADLVQADFRAYFGRAPRETHRDSGDSAVKGSTRGTLPRLSPRAVCRIRNLVSFFEGRFKKKLERSTRLIPVRRNSLFGLPEGTGAAPMTGAPAAHCLCIHRDQSLEDCTA